MSCPPAASVKEWPTRGLPRLVGRYSVPCGAMEDRCFPRAPATGRLSTRRFAAYWLKYVSATHWRYELASAALFGYSLTRLSPSRIVTLAAPPSLVTPRISAAL